MKSGCAAALCLGGLLMMPVRADAQIDGGATFYFTIGAPLASTAMP